MIYFNVETQAALIERFAEKLDPSGYLIMVIRSLYSGFQRDLHRWVRPSTALQTVILFRVVLAS